MMHTASEIPTRDLPSETTTEKNSLIIIFLSRNYPCLHTSFKSSVSLSASSQEYTDAPDANG